MAEQFIFTMIGLNKRYGQKHVLKDVGLSFYPGAKIGIVGENGSGKSTVLRIMAGEDTDFDGRAELSKGYTAGSWGPAASSALLSRDNAAWHEEM